MKNTSTLILLRGIPGSGKSTIAKQLMNTHDQNMYHFEADQFFVGWDNVYRYDPNRIAEAHQWCQDATKRILMQKSSVVVSNTFTTEKELRPYFNIARDINPEGVAVVVLTACGPFKNVHGVPEDVLTKMRVRFDHAAGDRLMREYFPNGWSV